MLCREVQGRTEDIASLERHSSSESPASSLVDSMGETLFLLRSVLQFRAVHIHPDSPALQTRRAVVTNSVWQERKFGYI